MRSIKDKVKEQLSLSQDIKVIRIIDKIFNFAIGCEADEIRFERKSEWLAVEFWADEELKDSLLLPGKLESAVLAGVRETAGMNYPADNLVSAGGFKKDYPGYKVIFSLRAHPTQSGEKLIINLKKEKFEFLGLGRLGLESKSLAKVKKALSARKGLVLVVGSSGSGLTSTLYSLINHLERPDLNIATMESEVVCDLPGINQSRLRPRLGFGPGAAAQALRRQDADVVMIGEINDRETAEAAFHLAQSGRFVLTGIVAHDIPAALNILSDWKISSSLFAANTKLVITQDLVEKNCPFCLSKQRIGPGNLRRLENKLDLARLLPRLRRDKMISAKITKPGDMVFYKNSGCQRCQEGRASGKIGIFEILAATTEVKELIKSGHFSALSREIKKQGGYSLVEDALAKALGGLIPLEAVLELL
jgi:type II secretory ATPase GspE/PulE/Tfp pilus assembly ATPase PilB-like protein